MKKKRIWAYIILTLLVAVYVVLYSVNLNPLYPEGAFFYCVVLSIYLATYCITDGTTLVFESDSSGRRMRLNRGNKSLRVVIVIAAAAWLIYFGVSIYSSVLFHSSAYRDQLGEYQERVFTEEISTADFENVPIVDEELARKLADKKLGERPALGSQVVLGDPVIQYVNGKLVWVVPLQHSGFFKWLQNMEGSAGYIVVSATNMQDCTYVEDYKIKYQPGAYFFDNLMRHARFSGGLFTGLTDYSFELNEEGEPFWVITTYKNLVGFSLPEATGILLVNAQTGEVSRHTLENLPDWVDRVQPESFIMEQLNNKGTYVHGIFNFSNFEKYETSQGEMIIYNDGRCYLFTGLTSVGSDESAIGFVMVDMVTKESIMYRISGATEYAAQGSAEGKVQNLDYRASFPLILNISNQPTYFMTLKDYEGLIKQYAFVSVKDYSVVGTGETIVAAQRDYEQAIRNAAGSGEDIDFNETTQKTKVEGTVLRIAAEVSNGTTIYKVIIDTRPDIIFHVLFDLSDELALTKEGDLVALEFYDTGEKPFETAVSFDNLMFSQR